jgi:acetyltransferase-like isoleucine patch superfamily enzyme
MINVIKTIINNHSIYFVNFIFQKILLIDFQCKWSKHYTSKIINHDKIKIENNCLSVRKSFAVSGGCYYQAYAGIEIGQGTIWSYNVSMITLDHDINNFSSGITKGAIKIGRNCWIGAGSVILSGVKLGDNTIVGANSVVNKSFENGSVVIGGVPAKIIKEL